MESPDGALGGVGALLVFRRPRGVGAALPVRLPARGGVLPARLPCSPEPDAPRRLRGGAVRRGGGLVAVSVGVMVPLILAVLFMVWGVALDLVGRKTNDQVILAVVFAVWAAIRAGKG